MDHCKSISFLPSKRSSLIDRRDYPRESEATGKIGVLLKVDLERENNPGFATSALISISQVPPIGQTREAGCQGRLGNVVPAIQSIAVEE